MKKLSFLLAGLAFSISFGQIEITQNEDTSTILTPHSVTCGQQGAYTGDNTFSRSFYLSNYGIDGDFYVTSVGFGVESISGTLPFTLTLAATEEFPWGDLTELHSEVIDLGVADEFTIIDHSFATPVLVPAGTDELMMSFQADGELSNISWYPASNDAGETGPTFITAPACGITEPSTMATIGFADVHVIMTVTGETAMGTVELNSRAISVYPNPATDVINVTLKNGATVQNFEIINLAGQSVFASQKAINSANVSFLPAGVYVVKVKDSNGVTHISKVVKK